jgi:MoaA/NifB/PqqE/SkfB family radical SAM enzyme
MNELLSVQLETTNICNAKCLFCPHDKFEHFGVMQEHLFRKIVDDLATVDTLETFIPMLTGEPFCDKDFISRLRYAREKLPNVRFELYTNGGLLTEKIADELLTVSDLHINISVNGIKPQTRLDMTGLDDFWKLYRTIQYMQNKGMSLRFSAVAHPAMSIEEQAEFVRSGGIMIQYQSWAGEIYPYERKRWTSCVRAKNTLTVNYLGQVCLCCFDPFCKQQMGDLTTESVGEVWTNEKRKEYQRLHNVGRGNELPLCRRCTEG